MTTTNTKKVDGDTEKVKINVKKWGRTNDGAAIYASMAEPKLPRPINPMRVVVLFDIMIYLVNGANQRG